MRRLLVLLPLPVLVGCPVKPITEVTLTGTVFDGPDSLDGVASGTVEVRAFDGTVVDSTTADASGQFSITAPAGQPAFMVVAGPDHIPTSFTVNIGTVDMAVPDQIIWARRASIHDDIVADFEGCPPDSVGGGMLEGEVRLYLGDIDDPGSEPLVTTAVAYIDDDAGSLVNACYLDEGGASDPSATVTGGTGRYAIPGAPEGPTVLVVTYDSGDTLVRTEALVYVPEGGTVPGYPTYVSLP